LLEGAVARSGGDGAVVCPRYLDASDEPWLTALIQEYHRFAGKRRRELDARLREPLPVQAPRPGLQRARHVLDRVCIPGGAPPKRCAALREALFVEGADRAPRPVALARAAERLGSDPDAIMEGLFADLPSECELLAPPPELDATELRLRTNLALVQALCARSTRVDIDLWGNARAIVRLAQLRGLLCVVRPVDDGEQQDMPVARMELSGPLSLFRRTRMYGRALSSIVPHLCWCDRFELRAELLLDETPVTLCVREGAPIFPARRPKPFDSKVEARFARDFGRLATGWEVHREPQPISAGERIIFPDFALQHRHDPKRVVLLEIVGFWTAEYLRDKLRHLREAAIPELILCIDASRDCDEAELPAGAKVVRYRRRIDAGEVLAVLR
jgi:hypothetical protein